MKFLQILWKTSILDPSRPDKAGVPLALSHSNREWGPRVLQHRCHTQPAAAPAALQSRDVGQKDQRNTWRGHCTGRGHRNSAQSGGTQGMKDSGKEWGFVSSITQEQFLLSNKPRLKLFTGRVREQFGERWEKLSSTQLCSNTESAASPEVLDEGGEGGTGGMKNRTAGSKVKTSDRREETSVSQKEWEEGQPDFWGAAEVESRATPCCSNRERNPWNPCSWRGFGVGIKERGKSIIEEGKAVYGKGTSRQERAGILSSGKQQCLTRAWLPGLNPKNTSSGTGEQEESLCCLQRRRSKETAISGCAELSFRTEFRVQNSNGRHGSI